MSKKLTNGKEHKHKWLLDKSYGESFCKICGKWDYE